MNKIFLFILLAPSLAVAVPSISELSGTPGDGNSLTISGSGFFNHPNPSGYQKPGWFHDFEDNTLGPDTSLSVGTSWHSDTAACMSITTANAAEGTHSIRHDVGSECPDNFQEAYIKIKSSEGFGFPLSGYLVWSIHRINEADTNKSENWKYFRIAQDDNDFYPNIWIGEAADDSPTIVTENCANTPSRLQYFSYSQPNSSWKEDSFFGKRESTNYGTDGYFYSRQNGTITGSSTTWSYNCSGQDTGSLNYFVIEDDISNDRESVSGYAYYDYVYIDTACPVYVMFTDASTLGGSSKFWMQPYTAMASSEITIEQKFTDLGSNADNIYVYVCEQGNSCSSGVQLSSAGEGGGGGSPSAIGNDLGGKTSVTGRAVIN